VAEIEANRFDGLPVMARHADQATRLPRHHDDPFDRMLIAESRVDGLVCISRVPVFRVCGVPCLR
jgi:PIN domain nuclease of toxin-antitoxin system